MGDIYPNAVL